MSFTVSSLKVGPEVSDKRRDTLISLLRTSDPRTVSDGEGYPMTVHTRDVYTQGGASAPSVLCALTPGTYHPGAGLRGVPVV